MSHLKDPTTQYYTGEYPKQKQPTPGIQAKMTPVPDCGEKTYVGSGRLKDRKALVTGGDSGIGRAAAIAYAREGADVAISYLPVEEEDAQDVKKIIEDHGGRIWATSKEGIGTEMHFVLRKYQEVIQNEQQNSDH